VLYETEKHTLPHGIVASDPVMQPFSESSVPPRVNVESNARRFCGTAGVLSQWRVRNRDLRR
jgi:hypothetical protein